MRRNWLTLGALFACVAALGLFVWLKPPKTQQTTFVLSTVKPAEARALQILRKGNALAALEKRGEEWFLTTPLQAPADALQVLRLLAVLEAKSTAQYPAADAGKFELAPPQAEIVIDRQRFGFGAINNVTREQYVLTQERIFPVELRFGAAVPADAIALLRKSLLASHEVPLRFEFGTFSVVHDAKKWNTTPATGEASQDDYNRWVAQWQSGSGLRAEPADKRTPAGEVLVTLKDGKKITLHILQTAPELVVRRADLGLQFVFTGDIGKPMLAPPGTPRK